MAYIAQLNYTNNQQGYLDVNTWRLPKTERNFAVQECDIPGLRGYGYFCNESEIGHIFYDEFNGQKESGLPVNWPFRTTVDNYYWSSTASFPFDPGGQFPVENARYSFNPYTGYQRGFSEKDYGVVWPVTHGDPLARLCTNTRSTISGNLVIFLHTDVNTTSTHG